jgi:hypothetical protein
MRKRVGVVSIVGMTLGFGCTTVSREPVAFAPSTYHAFDTNEYVFRSWVSGRSCEKYASFQRFGYFRIGETDEPRSVERALRQALTAVKGTVFLANISVENETRDAFLEPLEICTVVSGAAMVAKSSPQTDSKSTRSNRDKPAPPERAPRSPDDEEDDAPSR